MTSAVQAKTAYKIKGIEIVLEVGQVAASDVELAEYLDCNRKTIGERQRISQAVLEATEEKDKTIRLLQGALKKQQKDFEPHSRHAVSCGRGIQTGCHGDYPFRNGTAQVGLCTIDN